MFLKAQGNGISLIDDVFEHIPSKVFRMKDYMKARGSKTSG